LAKGIEVQKYNTSPISQANGYIASFNGGLVFSFDKNGVRPGNGSASHFYDLNLNLDLFAIAQWPVEIRFQMNRLQPHARFIDHCGIVNAHLAAEKLLQRHMKIMEKTRVIDDAGMIDVTNPNFE
jgi:hypothetical protein